MNDHLAGITQTTVRSARLETRLLMSGAEDGEPVVFLHGNLSSATFWEETMLALPGHFQAVAPDQRGYGSSDRAVRIDATRGVADWADDVLALADHFGWEDFHLVAHSLGGCVAWALLGMQANRLRSVTLVSPGPPCGFGGAHGLRGELNHDDGAGSGAGLVHPEFAKRLSDGERSISHEFFSPRAVMCRAYWKPPFQAEREEQLLSGMLEIHCGTDQFPGGWVPSQHWPGFAPGHFGPINAMSPRYNQHWLQQLLESPRKPPALWIYGADDVVVSDESPSDPGCQGKLGIRPDWPGESVFPPQPLLTQVTYALDQYQAQGGTVRRLVLPNVGHTPYLESPRAVKQALIEHLEAE